MSSSGASGVLHIKLILSFFNEDYIHQVAFLLVVRCAVLIACFYYLDITLIGILELQES